MESDLNNRIFNITLERVFEKVYNGLEEEEKKEMEKIIPNGTDKEKQEFVEKYIPNFKEIFQEELIKVAEEIQEEIKNQN
jgi:hypothetical protein